MTAEPANTGYTSLPDADRAARRNALVCARNTGESIDYLIALTGKSEPPRYLVHLRYVPDKLLLLPASFAAYLTKLGDHGLDGPTLALTILEDINNELVPRWVEVAVDAIASSGKTNGTAGRVLVTDRQPNWDNPALLARLSPW